jgi:outer membrane protein assembly factor BamB
MRTFITFALSLFLTSNLASADDALANWPHWRGPLANGIAPDADPPISWDAETNVKWKVALPGEGHATPIIWGDRIYLLSAVRTERAAPPPETVDPDAKTTPPGVYFQYVVLCLDRETGETIWSDVAIEAPPVSGRHDTNSYASGSPTTDGRRLYASFGSHGIFCYDMDGNRLWERDLGDMRTRFGWGEASTPVIHGDSLVVNWDHEDQSFIAVLDAATGDTKWQLDRDEVTTWATPLVVDHDGQSQVIVCGTNRIRSYDLSNGEVLWACGGLTVNAIPSPLMATPDDDVVICMSGYRGAAAFAIPLASRGDITDSTSIRWRLSEGTPYVPSPILVDGRLYFTQGNTNVITCVDAETGAILFGPERLEGIENMYASPVAAAGRIYFTGREGTTTVIAAGDTLEVLSVNELGETIDASPAVVGNEIYLRTATQLFCIAESN